MKTNRWFLETSKLFDKEMKRLDKSNKLRVKEYLQQICELENPKTRGKELTGNLSGVWCYRVGSYRILAEIVDDEFIVLALDVGHRSKVYKT